MDITVEDFQAQVRNKFLVDVFRGMCVIDRGAQQVREIAKDAERYRHVPTHLGFVTKTASRVKDSLEIKKESEKKIGSSIFKDFLSDALGVLTGIWGHVGMARDFWDNEEFESARGMIDELCDVSGSSKVIIYDSGSRAAAALMAEDGVVMRSEQEFEKTIKEVIQVVLNVTNSRSTCVIPNISHIPEIGVGAHDAHLTTVLVKLVNNAYIAIDKKEYGEDIEPALRFNVQHKKDRLWVDVSDNGIGMPPEISDLYNGRPLSVPKNLLSQSIPQCIRIIEERLRGELKFVTISGEATTARVKIPL